MSSILHKIRKLAEEEDEKARKIDTILSLVTEDIYYGNSDLEFLSINKMKTHHLACAVDGSKYQLDVGDFSLIIARAVKVKGILENEGKKIPPDVKEDVKLEDNYYGEDKVSKDAILLMLTLETEILSSCSDCDIIFIDGPIIDPPTYDENDEDLKRFHEARKLVISNNDKIIGIVKRFAQRFLISKLINEGYAQLIEARESYVVQSLFYKLRQKLEDYKNPRFLGWISWNDIFSSKYTTDLAGLGKAYVKYNVKMYSGYFQENAISPVARIDVLKPDNEKLAYIATWSYQGINEVTILNKLADDISNVSKAEAEAYLKLLVSARKTLPMMRKA
ncbi:DNA double-strand break repair nuclease NurA [Acidianus sp. HS-5]|uniref:DNA double-strand break repair nuclease NurA n=1 Tax=Acidianus sp. HS-5 TaxID=2886040 RepID=UPI001F1B533B|nr:DNA double-strand break repair nuclease NurA [Acidianus sp. HS-5]BDC18394.1 hypothetical protein HS5_12840 [Acidianus sp. HS-5]